MSKILIIDDDRFTIEQLCELLNSFGHKSAFVPKPSYAIERLESENFDLILMDVNMPEIDGLELLERIKEKPKCNAIPVVMMTGEGDQKTLSKCFELGASDYIEKPIQATILKARVNAILKSQEYTNKLLEFEENKTTQYKLRSLISQMNPHFIFNVLNSIQFYVLEDNKEVALENISQFSKLVRTSLNHSDKDLITLEDELEFLTTYLKLEADRFRNKLDFELKLDEDLDIEDIQVPPMLIQPFLENSIVHGISNKETKGKLTISISASANKLLWSIMDDGVGRIKAKNLKKLQARSYESKGMNLTELRLKMLNKTHSGGFDYKIEDLNDKNNKPAGTLVTVTMPLLSKWEKEENDG